MHSPLLAPVIALVLWSLVMTAWMYATRIPAMVRGKVSANPYKPASEFHARLPAPVRWKADNLNNLMEQPTIFYATALTLALLGADSMFNVGLAWLYVALRVAHSVFQATVNFVPVRFFVFIGATLVLSMLAVRTALTVF
jgi:hypothetical protein